MADHALENLAVVALSATLKDGKFSYTAVAIGTRVGEPNVWRIGALPWNEFKLQNVPILGKTDLLKEGFAPRYDGGYEFGLAPFRYADRDKRVVSNLVRLALLPSGGAAGNSPVDPIVSLDTQGFLSFRGAIETGSADPTEAAGLLLVSNLKFAPDTDGDWDGTITGFDFHGSVASPMFPNETAFGPENSDMRTALIGLAVQNPTDRRTLWSDTGATREEPGKGSFFDRLILRQTRRSLANVNNRPRRTETEDDTLNQARITDFFFPAWGFWRCPHGQFGPKLDV